MDPHLLPQRFGGAAGSNLHPVIVIALFMVAALVFLLPRRYVIVPLLVATFLIPMDQSSSVGPFHFQMARILISLGWIRLVVTKFTSRVEILSGGLNAIDKALIFCSLFGALDFVLLWGSSDAVVNQMGILYTTFGGYFLLRFFIRDQEDVNTTIRALAYIAVPIALIMMYEQSTGKNPYSLLGGAMAAARSTLMRRDNGIRAMASFEHPITAGAFGAILFPLFVGLWSTGKKNHVSSVIGNLAAAVIVLCSVSSTGLLAYVAALTAFSLWPLRNHMRLIRRGIVFTLITLHMIMKAPVWALIGHMGVIGGSDSWHREYVVDQFIRRFGDWWLIGTRDNYNWGWDMWDITNQYVAIGFSGGVLPFIFFVAVIVYGFKYVGRARIAVEGDKQKEFFFWALGAALFANAAAFFGVIFFDQIQIAWYTILAMISAATAGLAVRRPESHASTDSTILSSVPSPFATAKATSAPAAEPLSDVHIRTLKSPKSFETSRK